MPPVYHRADYSWIPINMINAVLDFIHFYRVIFVYSHFQISQAQATYTILVWNAKISLDFRTFDVTLKKAYYFTEQQHTKNRALRRKTTSMLPSHSWQLFAYGSLDKHQSSSTIFHESLNFLWVPRLINYLWSWPSMNLNRSTEPITYLVSTCQLSSFHNFRRYMS